MASFHGNNGRLVLAYRWQGRLFREYLGCADTRENRRQREQLRRAVSYEIKAGSFDWAKHFHCRKHAVVTAPGALTLSTCAQAWLKTQTQLGADSKGRKDYEYVLRHYLDELTLPDGGTLGAIDPRVLRLDQVAELIEGRSISLTKIFLRKMREVIDQQVIASGIHQVNVFRLIKNPRKVLTEAEIEAGEGFIMALTVAEQIRLLNAVKGRDRLIIAIGLGCGLRPTEILRVQYQDIDLAHSLLYVRGTKTRGSKREVRLRGRVLEMLREELTAHPAQIGRLFSGEKLGRPLNRNKWTERVWHPALAAAGIKDNGPMSMRHTFAIERLKAGDDPVEVAKQLGHSSTHTLHQHYGRFTRQLEKEEASQ